MIAQRKFLSAILLGALALPMYADEPAITTGRYALATARQWVEKRNYPEAIKWYQRLVKAKPDDSDLLIEAARVYGWADRNKESAELYQRVINKFPARRNDVVPSLAAQLLWANNPGAAIPLFEEILARKPADRDATLGLAEGLQSIQRYDKAIALYDGLLTKNRADEAAQRGKAWALLRTDQFSDAEQSFRGILQSRPTDMDARVGLARTLNFSGRHQEAIRAYDQLAQDFPKDKGIQVQRATAHYWAGMEQEALKIVDTINTDEAENLRNKILRNTKPVVSGGVAYSKDKDDLKITRGQVSGKVPIGETASIEVGYSRAALKGKRKTREMTLSGSDINNLKLNGVNASAARITDDTRILNVDIPGGRSLHVPVDTDQQGDSFRSGDWNESGQLTGQQLSFTYSDRFGSAYSEFGLVTPRVTLGLRDYDGWRSGLVRIGAKWIPADLWRFDIEAGNDIVENLDSIDNRVKLNYLSGSVDHSFDPRWNAGGGLFLGKFDDGNRRTRLTGRLEYVAQFKPRLSFGLEGLGFRDSKQAFRDVTLRFDDLTVAGAAALPNVGSITFREAGRGYYNPKHYAEAKLFGAISYDQDAWSLWAKLAIGGVRETPFDGDTSNGVISSAELNYAYHITSQSELRFSIGRSSSRVSSSEGGGYYRNFAGLYFTHWFDY
jgi:tetratricopeptide (TPR) repeat protein